MRMIRMRGCALMVIYLLLASAAQGGELQFRFGSSISMPTLEDRIAETQSNSELDEKTRNTLIKLYRSSIRNLETQATHLTVIAANDSDIEQRLSEINRLREETAALRKKKLEPVELPTGANRNQIVLEYSLARAEVAKLETTLNRLKSRLESIQQRLPAVREELAAAIDQQVYGIGEADTMALVEDPLLLKQARRWLRETTQMELGARINRLGQELFNHSPWVALVRKQIELAKLKLERHRMREATLAQAWGESRQARAIVHHTRALEEQQLVAGNGDLLEPVARLNVQLTEHMLRYVANTNALIGETAEVADQTGTLEMKFRNLRHKLQVAGMSTALGQVLQDQRERLPIQHDLEQALTTKQSIIAELTLEHLAIEDRLRVLDDIPAYIEFLRSGDRGKNPWRALGSSVPALDEEQTSQLNSLLEQQRRLYKILRLEIDFYLQFLGDFEYLQRRLLNTVKTYHRLLAERSLWVRSVSDMQFSNMINIPEDRLRYFSASEFRRVYQALLDLIRYRPVMVAVIFVAFVLLWMRPNLKNRLVPEKGVLGNPLKDRYRFTVQAFVWTVLLALPGPLILGSFGFGLWSTQFEVGMVAALGPALRWCAFVLFVLVFFYEVCCPEGLAQCHFRWPPALLASLRRNIFWLFFVFLPLGFVNFFLIAIDPAAITWEYLRLSLALNMIVLLVFFFLLLVQPGELFLVLRRAGRGAILLKLRWFWMVLAVLIPVVMITLNAQGYVHTVFVVQKGLVMTMSLFLMLIVCQQMGVRWLRLASIRLKYQSLKDKQKKRRGGGTEGGQFTLAGLTGYEERAIDLGELNRDSIKLLNTLILMVAIAGILVIWSGLIPALSFLDKIQLWSASSVINGEPVLRPITLADLAISLIILGAVVLLYQNLPSLLRLLFMDVFSMSDSAHYAAVNLTLYTLVMVGLTAIAALMGFDWSKFQWLAAALGVGIGFGLQEIVANFISGLIILLERPIAVGDLVTVGEVEGFVTRIRIRATTILTYDRQELLVPNKAFITGNLLNWSLSDQISRLVVDVGVAYGTDVPRAMAIITDVAGDDPAVIAEPNPFVIFEGFGDSVLNLRLLCFIDDIEARVNTRSRLYQEINRRFSEAGIDIAFPQMDVHFDQENSLNIKIQPE